MAQACKTTIHYMLKLSFALIPIMSFQRHFAPGLDKKPSLHALISVLEQNDLAN